MNISVNNPALSLLVIAVVALMLGLGCASSAAVPAETPTAANPGAVASGGAVDTPEAAAIPVGASVGERVPGFAILLADGTTVTSQELALQGKPAFLMFFATW